MSLFKDKVKEIDRSKVKKVPLRFTVELSIETQESYSNKKIAYIKVDEDLVCTTHDYIEQLKNELESIISASYKKVESKLDTSELLADGYKDAI